MFHAVCASRVSKGSGASRCRRTSDSQGIQCKYVLGSRIAGFSNVVSRVQARPGIRIGLSKSIQKLERLTLT